MRDGYDLPVYGLDSNKFYALHIPALTCIFISLCSVVTTIILIFRHRSYKTFFTWMKSERFIVYLAVCDGAFNVAHSMDHLHILIVRDHVRPKELCQFYAFMLAEFITAQNLMVNIIAINAFVLIYFNNNVNFGKRDYRLLLWTFGTPFVCASLATILGQLGPTGSFCYFDGVKGLTANFLLTTVPLSLIVIINSVLYILTWRKISVQEKELKTSLGNQSSATSAKHAAVRTMSLFVLVFLLQWFPMAIYGVWSFSDPGGTPTPVFHLVTTFSNIGGALNLIVYIYIRRRLSVKSFNHQRLQGNSNCI